MLQGVYLFMSRDHIKHLLRERLIREGEKEIPELREFAKIVYRSLIDAVYSNVMSLHRKNENVSARDLFDSLEDMDITGQVLSELEPETFNKLRFFIQAVNDSKMNFIFEHTKEMGLTGEFVSESNDWNDEDSKSLIIYYNARELTGAILEGIDGLSIEKEDHKVHMAVKKVLSTYRRDMIKSMVHELQHAYDDYRSGGDHTDEEDRDITQQIVDLAKNIGPDDEIDQETSEHLHNLYISLPYEVWARFAEVVSIMEEDGLFEDSSDFNDVMKSFKEQMEGFDIISERMRKRITKALYKFWYNGRS